jgi:hypothetical protein
MRARGTPSHHPDGRSGTTSLEVPLDGNSMRGLPEHELCWLADDLLALDRSENGADQTRFRLVALDELVLAQAERSRGVATPRRLSLRSDVVRPTRFPTLARQDVAGDRKGSGAERAAVAPATLGAGGIGSFTNDHRMLTDASRSRSIRHDWRRRFGSKCAGQIDGMERSTADRHGPILLCQQMRGKSKPAGADE